MSSINPSLDQFLGDCRQRVNTSLQALLDRPQPSDKLREAMAYACLNGGKRLRPVLVYGAVSALEGEAGRADAAACAVELMHSYSLAHDDLPAMDDDDMRRGQPSLHKAYDEATAILVGDALQALAFECLGKAESLPAKRQLAMLQCLAEAVGAWGMVGGQSLDFEAVGQTGSDDALETLHRLKTGALIRASVLLGAMSTDHAGPESLASLGRYAEHIGLAFQVQDDILDETGDSAVLGKPRGSDQANNKPTYVSLLGLDGARKLAMELADQAVAELKDFPDGARYLRELARYIVSRGY